MSASLEALLDALVELEFAFDALTDSERDALPSSVDHVLLPLGFAVKDMYTLVAKVAAQGGAAGRAAPPPLPSPPACNTGGK